MLLVHVVPKDQYVFNELHFFPQQ